ncbi:MAG: hypothetical protein ABJL55_16510 [Roseibium sp.]
MTMPQDFQEEYQLFLRDTGFEDPDPRELLTDLVTRSMEVYPREIAWLSRFIGRLDKARYMAA